MSASTSWVLWCEPKTIRNQFFVLFRKCNKIMVNDIFKITTTTKKNNKKKTTTEKPECSRKQFIIRNVCSNNCKKKRTTYSQGYLYG